MIKKCEICGKEFEAKRWTARYCSDKCKNDPSNNYYAKHRAERLEYQKKYYEQNKEEIRDRQNKMYMRRVLREIHNKERRINRDD